MLTLEGWYVIKTHGNVYSHGLPDLYCCHRKYGTRWVEVKNPVAYSFTRAQQEVFPLMVANGAGVWVLVAGTQEEYKKLFQPCNWYLYLSIFSSNRRV